MEAGVFIPFNGSIRFTNFQNVGDCLNQNKRGTYRSLLLAPLFSDFLIFASSEQYRVRIVFIFALITLNWGKFNSLCKVL